MNPDILLPSSLIALVFIAYWVVRFPQEFGEALLFRDTPPWVSVLTWVFISQPALYLVLKL